MSAQITVTLPLDDKRALVFSYDELVELAHDRTGFVIQLLEQTGRVALADDDPDSIAKRCQLARMPEIERYTS